MLGAARNVACAGGEPLALTDCLNFGNPEKAEIGWELAEAIEGIAQAAEALGHPVVRQRLALQRDGRPRDPAHADRRLRGTRPGRPARAARGWRRATSVGSDHAGGLDLAVEAALVSFLWRVAPHCSLIHDGTIEEAARWSGVAPRVDVPARAAAILACAPGDVGKLKAWS